MNTRPAGYALHVTPAKPATFVQPPLGPPSHHHRDSDMRDKESWATELNASNKSPISSALQINPFLALIVIVSRRAHITRNRLVSVLLGSHHCTTLPSASDDIQAGKKVLQNSLRISPLRTLRVYYMMH